MILVRRRTSVRSAARTPAAVTEDCCWNEERRFCATAVSSSKSLLLLLHRHCGHCWNHSLLGRVCGSWSWILVGPAVLAPWPPPPQPSMTLRGKASSQRGSARAPCLLRPLPDLHRRGVERVGERVGEREWVDRVGGEGRWESGWESG